MAISRRDFLKAVGVGATAAAIFQPMRVFGDLSIRPKYQLKSTPDEGTVLDKAKADRVRQLAEYVFSTRDPRFLSYEQIIESDMIGTAAGMYHDGIMYTITVTSSTNRDLPRVDNMRIYSVSIDSGKIDVAYFNDFGLAARVNKGVLPRGHRLNRTGLSLTLDHKEKIGLQYQAIFDKVYNSTVDNLIRLYFI